MSDIAIRIENLSKQYYLGNRVEQYKTLREGIVNVAMSPVRRLRAVHNESRRAETMWALKDVSFDVERGEVVGIIGRNGAGKSTLLKVLSRITKPTTGRAEVYGRVGSLLEVGTGFHSELTGRENIYLNGAILGMRKVEINRKFDEIVAFAEIEKFLDTPVKHYSSGMYVRLAFAVAAHLEPEILMVDEVLAVGDAPFQKKCLGKMGDVAKEGRTVLLVSHNMAAIESLCQKTIWLQEGKLVKKGDTGQTVAAYLLSAESSIPARLWENIETAPGNEKVRIRRACVRRMDGPSPVISIRDPFIVEFEYWNLVPGYLLELSFHLVNEYGNMVFNPASYLEEDWHAKPCPRGLFRTRCHIPGDLMNDGTFTLSLNVTTGDSTLVFRYPDLLQFTIVDAPEMRGAWHGRWPGAVRPNFKWTTEFLQAGDRK